MEKKSRLRRSADFRKVREQGRSSVHPLLVLYVFPNQLDHNRFGFSVSRRIGGAVVRNRVKRRIREAARSLKDEVEPGWDLIFIARSHISDADFRSIKQAVRFLLQRACLLRLFDVPVSPDGMAKNSVQLDSPHTQVK
jgi:ribonuclease P protein component